MRVEREVREAPLLPDQHFGDWHLTREKKDAQPTPSLTPGRKGSC